MEILHFLRTTLDSCLRRNDRFVLLDTLRFAAGFFILLFSIGCASQQTTENSFSVAELYAQGNKSFTEKKYKYAVESFKKIKTEFPESSTMSRVRLKIGESYYLDKKFEEAVSEYKQFLDYHPANKNKDMAKYRIGASLYNQMLSSDLDQSKTEEAMKQFKDLLKDNPNSPYAPKSGEKIKKCIERLARHEYSIGNFYYRTGKYKAATKRLSGLLENYPDQKIEPMAIILLAESYWEAEERERALKTYKELLSRYPKTSYSKHAAFMLKQYGEEYGIDIELKQKISKKN